MLTLDSPFDLEKTIEILEISISDICVVIIPLSSLLAQVLSLVNMFVFFSYLTSEPKQDYTKFSDLCQSLFLKT